MKPYVYASAEVNMSLDKTPTSDRLQTVTAVLFMGLFAAVFLIITLPQGTVSNFVCNSAGARDVFPRMCSTVSFPPPEGPGELVASRIDSACVDAQGLKISVVFDEPLTGAANIQVFSTGPDFFPSGEGMTDTYDINQTISTAVDHLDLVIPVDAMPVGEQIFGNIIVSEGAAYSHVAYVINVSDCSTTSTLPSNPALAGIPIIQSATCLPNRQLMIAFEFEKPVVGQYRALIDDTPYELSSVVSQPAMLFFSGEPPSTGPISIRLISVTDQAAVFDETFTPPDCGGS